jgi:chitodextrinase
VTSTTIALSWAVSTDSGGSGLDKYWVWRDGVNVATVTAPTASDTDPGLTPSTAYSYQVSAWDKAGNQSALSAARSVTTSAAPDTTLPTAPPSLSTTTVSSTTVTLSWGDSTDAGGSGLAGYRVVRDGVFMTTATTTSFSDASVSPSRTYVYTVQAVDGAGNLSSATTKTVTTPAATVGGGSVGPSSVTMVETAAFPNPAVGKDPTIRAFVGDTDILEVTIYDASGSVVHSDRVTGGPTGTASDGRPYHDYVWTGKKASGVYFAVVHGKKGGDVIRGRTKFVVVR